MIIWFFRNIYLGNFWQNWSNSHKKCYT